MEEEMLKVLHFDFNMISPLTFLERFLRISDFYLDPSVSQLSHHYIKLAMASIAFLDYRPSHLAAAALLLAISVLSQSAQKFKMQDHCLNFWNKKLTTTTGIKVEDFTETFKVLLNLAQ